MMGTSIELEVHVSKLEYKERFFLHFLLCIIRSPYWKGSLSVVINDKGGDCWKIGCCH
jgi:hypothetical protein